MLFILQNNLNILNGDLFPFIVDLLQISKSDDIISLRGEIICIAKIMLNL